MQTDCSLSNYAVLHGMPRYTTFRSKCRTWTARQASSADLVETLCQRGVLAEPRATER